MSMYVLQTGEYSRRTNYLVTGDVKLAAETYTSMIEQEALGDPYDSPLIEIWNEDDRKFPTASFQENTKNTRQLIKYLSKLSRQIQDA